MHERAAVKMQSRSVACFVATAIVAVFLASPEAAAQSIPAFDRGFLRPAETPEDVVTTLEIVALLTVLTLAPSILVMMTAFTRIVIVLSFLRRALATQELPPTQVVVGLSLILTFMVMGRTFDKIKNEALVPYIDGEISQIEAGQKALAPLRTFMFAQVRRSDLRHFLELDRRGLPPDEQELPRTEEDVPLRVLLPAFVTSELRKSFEMGFVLYLPFLVIDLVVSAVLISMGMLVLPPVLISLPFKILLFVLVDGWNLVIGGIVASFNGG